MDDPKKSALLTYQLDLVQSELETLNSTIRAGDEITKSLKEWTLTIWTAAIGGALYNSELRIFIVLTSIIPALFWLVDTWHRIDQRKFIWRTVRIMDFLNDDRLERSFEAGKVVDFSIMDIASRRDRGKDFSDFTGFARVFKFKTLSVFYLSLIGASIVIWFVALKFLGAVQV